MAIPTLVDPLASRSAFTMASAVRHAVLSGWHATASAGSRPAGLAILSATCERSSARSLKAATVVIPFPINHFACASGTLESRRTSESLRCKAPCTAAE